MYKALILDMDGTTIDSKGMVTHSLTVLLAEYGIPLTEELRKRAFGGTGDGFVASLGLPEDPAVTLQKWGEIMLGMMGEVVLYPGIDAVLSAPIRRGIVTSEVREELDYNFTHLGIGSRFEFSVCADELPYQKPRPEPLLHCAAKMGLAVPEVLYVGDTPYDMDCARDAGVDFGLAAWGADKDMDASGAKYIFRRPEEILPYIIVD